MRLAMERREITAIESGRSGQRVERTDGARKFPIERGRIDAGGFEQSPFGRNAVVRKRAPHQNAREQSARKNGSEHQDQKINTE
jgi:hypothetical protein